MSLRPVPLPPLLAGVLAAVWTSCFPSAAATIRGRVEIEDRKGVADPSAAIVYLDALPTGAARASVPGAFVIETRDKRFRPPVLAVPVGATVAFPNLDPILHNVFSVSGGNRFDLGLYGKGEGKRVTFREAGLVRVYCNVHPHMAAFILVCPSPHFSRVRPDGWFEMEGVPAGSYEVKVWDERGSASRSVETGADGTVEVSLRIDAGSFKRKPHLDKRGKPYATHADEERY